MLTREGQIVGVFDYYADPDVVRKHQKAYIAVKNVLREFQTAFEQETNRKLQQGLPELWKDYVTEHLNRVVQFAKAYMDKRTQTLLPIWQAECDNAQSGQKTMPCSMSAIIKMYKSGRAGSPRFDTSIFA